jgi:pSer/pThr/pTyr-binding forkhead associated (FHA) protein
MAKLILSMDGLVLKEITLMKERTTIGRKPHNDIQIDNLAVSGEHAVIVTILNDSFLEDLGSTNGTLVNGQPIKKHFLQNNDVVELGKYKLKYMNEQPLKTGTPAEFEKTMVIRPGQMPKQEPPHTGELQSLRAMRTSGTQTTLGNPKPVPTAATIPAAMASSQGQRPLADSQPVRSATVSQPISTGIMRLAAVQILSGANAGREMDITKPLTTLGKPGVQVAVITKRPQGHFITHVEGASFPMVNGRSLDAQACPLNDHDVIELAGVKMEFFYKG